MWPFKKKVISTNNESDPTAQICKSLVERWYEWTQDEMDGDGGPALVNKSAKVVIAWNQYNVWIGFDGITVVPVDSNSTSRRLLLAIYKNIAARVVPRDDFDSVATSLARAVLSKDTTAMRALKDRLDELQSEGRL